MKTKLIFGSLLALSLSVYSQPNSNPWPSSGWVGIGTTTPGAPLDIQTSGLFARGIRLKHTGTGGGEATIRLDATSPGGREYAIHSIGSGWGSSSLNGCLMFRDETAVVPRMLITPSGDVGIGTTTPTGKLNVVGTTLGIRGDAGSGGSDTGVQGNGYFGVDGNGGVVGVRGSCQVPGGALNQGVRGFASYGTSNRAGYFQANGGASGIVSYGVYSEVLNPTAGGTNYGIYTTVGGTSGSGGTGPNYAAYFDGDVVCPGTNYFASDRTLKKEIVSIKNSMDIISKLNPVSYHFDTEKNPYMSLATQKQYGFISQEIQEILPELTNTIIHPAKLDETGKELHPKKEYLGLNYNGFIALLAKGMQEQQTLIEQQSTKLLDQEMELKEQKQLIVELQTKVGTSTGMNEINGTDGYKMDQNEPNPFNGETTIKYSLPQSINTANLFVYDLTGKQIATFPINEKGSSSIKITSENLPAGIYIYSIVADGKIVDSKRMIVAQK